MSGQPSPKRRRAWAASGLVLGLAVVLGLLTALLRYGPTTEPGQEILARLAGEVRVGDLGWLRVEGVAGDPWSDFTVQRLAIADRRGPWVTARNVSVRWRPAELLARRLRILNATAASITFERRPELLPPGPKTPPPVSWRIDHLAAKVVLTPAFAWRRGEYLLQGDVDVSRANAVRGRIDAVSVTHPGDYLRLGIDIGRRSVALEAHALEATGGALAGTLGLDPDRPFALDARAHGTPRAGWFTLTSAVGAGRPAVAAGAWRPSGGEASAHFNLDASRWFAPWRKAVGPALDLRLSAARQGGAGLYRLSLDARGSGGGLKAEGLVEPAARRTGPHGLSVEADLASLSALAGGPGLGPARLTGRLTGDDSRWRLDGAAQVEQVTVLDLTLARVAGPFQVQSGADGSLGVKADLQGAGGTGGGVAAWFLGAAPRASADLTWSREGRLTLRRLAAHGAALDLDGRGERSLLGALSFAGRAQAHNPGPDGGVILADWRATQGRTDAPWSLNLTAHGQGLRWLRPEMAALLGPTPDLAADARLDGAGLTLDHMRLTGHGLSATAVGTLSSAGDLRFSGDFSGRPGVGLGPLSITGPSAGSATLSGTLAHPRLDLVAGLRTVEVAGAPGLDLHEARLALNLIGADGGVFSGRAGLTASLDGGPARAGTAFQVTTSGLTLSDIDIDAGGVRARGEATLAQGVPAQTDLILSVGPGLLLTSGHAEGRAQIIGAGEGARAKISLAGQTLAFPGGAGTVSAMSLSAEGPLRALPYRLELKGASSGLGARLAGGGVLTSAGDEVRMSFNGAGRVGGADLRTLEPALVNFRPGAASGVLHLAVGKGRADINLTSTAGAVSGRAVVSALDLSLLDADIEGRADGVLVVSRLGDDLVGSVQAKVSDLAGADAQSGAPLNGSLDATFGGGVIDLRTALADGKGSHLTAQARLPANLTASPLQIAIDSRKPISGRFSADGAIGPVWDFFEGGGRTLSGHLTADGAIGGTLADPRLTGVAALDNGDFDDAAAGLRLRSMSIRADLKGDSIDVGKFSGVDDARGSITGEGRLSLLREGASGFRLALRDFRLFDTSLGQATASGALAVDRAADGKVRLSGALNIDRAQISPRAPTPSGVIPMEVVEIHGAAEADTGPAEPVERAPPVALDITLKAPGGVFIKGRGLNLEMSLDARVSGNTAAPDLQGVARVVRGDYDFAGKRFQIDDNSQVRLGSTLQTVRLNITASRDDPNITATITIGGTAAVPTLTLSSTPVLPKDEILSQVLFGASASQLSGLQAAQLASALAGLAGSGGFDIVGGLRNFAHLDRLAIDTAAAANATSAGGRPAPTETIVAGGKYVTDKVYVELSDGPRTGQGAQVEWRVRKHLAIVSRVTSQGDHAVSIRWRRDY